MCKKLYCVLSFIGKKLTVDEKTSCRGMAPFGSWLALLCSPHQVFVVYVLTRCGLAPLTLNHNIFLCPALIISSCLL
ncbi:hypothetical protein NC653_034599 [Populus alba x Populus x berolinensis]|uniref:Uncharacterized protein n=1 Tax=Populus alba x Populus x berolinensis TaxID=444605 RepID=A0AAD6PXZ9_9ROSI|nr:hypothetical protein NC653_034599 [Populus alba x Populus x berolinensis]